MNGRIVTRVLAAAVCAMILPACGGGGGGGGGGGPTLLPTPPGAIDPNFGAAGVAASPGGDEAYGAVVTGGFIYVVGGGDAIAGSDYTWRIEKRSTVDGSLDPAFGTGGVVTSNPGAGWDTANSVATDGTNLYIAGYANVTGGNYQWRIEKRTLTDGALVSAFGVFGVVTSNPSAGDDEPFCIAVDATGIYVGGYDFATGNYQWRVEKRDLTTGALVAGWCTGGVLTVNPTASTDMVTCMIVSGTTILIGGRDSTPGGGNYQYRIEKRNASDGVLVAAFGTAGILTANGTNEDYLNAMVIDGPALFLVGSTSGLGNRVERRVLSSGALDPTFGTGGLIDTPFNKSSYAAVVDAGILHLGGATTVGPDDVWYMSQRDGATGALDPAFDTDGEYIGSETGGNNYVLGMAQDASAVYFVGAEDIGASSQWRVEKWTK